jgi:hypothetical protein
VTNQLTNIKVNAALVELEIDEMIQKETVAISRVDQKFERQAWSAKRKKSLEKLQYEASLAKQAIKRKFAGRIAKIKIRAGLLVI